jgi:5'-nucleotidase
MAAGTCRGDQIYPRGVLKLGDIVNCFPFEDPIVVIRIPGASIKKALENGISKLPAFEGRFPHVSNIFYEYDSSLPAGNRIVSCKINGEDLVPDKKYTMATRYYMVSGRDGYEDLTPEHGGAEIIVDEENGILITMILRQYFSSLKVLSKWKRGDVFEKLFGELKCSQAERGELVQKHDADAAGADDEMERNSIHTTHSSPAENLAKNFGTKWARLANIVDWTNSIAPRLEGRIKDIKPKQEMDK